MTTQTQTPSTADSGWWDSASNFGGAVTDTFNSLADTYFKYKAAENIADANGQSQATLNNAVETQTAVGRTPLTSGQYEQVADQQAGIGLNQNTLLIGAALVAVVLFTTR